MAGVYGSRLPSSAACASSSSASSSLHRVLYLLTLLLLALAAFAFSLQWRGELNDPATINRLAGDNSKLPGTSPTNSHSPSTLDCSDPLGRSAFPAFPYRSDWKYRIAQAHPKICITTSTAGGLDQILPWLFYHQVIGVTNFFLFVEGKAASVNVSAVLSSIPGVKLVFRTKELEEQQAKSRIWNETWLSSFFFRPCNYELFVKQSLNMEMAIIMAREAGMDWIIHLDTDELLHPAGVGEYSLRRLLADVDKDVDTVIFPNYESAIERDDITDPFTQVSMFKKNYDHVTKESYFGLYKEATRGNPNYFLTYGNGKSAARVQEHLRPNGAHRWHNYMKNPKEIKFEEAAVLHFTYTKFSDLTSRRDRCGCKPTKEDVKRCFMLDFDRAAFIIASTASEEEMRNWYKDRVVWTDKDLNLKLMRKGLLTRIYVPSVIIQGLRESNVFANALAAAGKPSQQQPSASVSHPPKKSNLTSRSQFQGESDATARRLLTIEAFEELALPPLPPPSFDDERFL
ncbi:hypothetical protein GOP47_0005569 [Adiantum capillus-veneris]|uniref:Glycosyltransferase family 92 protein n=1 Tax=Adiantum capillus-veneris TaxID=13818 RepID=A0A9D4V5Z9_ADICA|nr:hypothetical protein GOP47_0005569 [Adiantum capillus-veneris]